MKKLLLVGLMMMAMVSCNGHTETASVCVNVDVADSTIYYEAEGYTTYYNEENELCYRFMIDSERNFEIFVEASVCNFIDCKA